MQWSILETEEDECDILSPVLHAEFSCILHAKEFLLYFTWQLPVRLLRVYNLTPSIISQLYSHLENQF